MDSEKGNLQTYNLLYFYNKNSKLVKGKPLERVGRKATGLTLEA